MDYTVPTYQEWQADVAKVMAPVIPWLQNRVRQGGAKLAIVLDVDNTALATYYHPDQPNPPVLALAQWAHLHHVLVLFATARLAAEYETTLSQLHNAGYPVDGLCMRKSDREPPAAVKQRCRQEFTAAGYTITVNIGNRPTDLAGGNYEKGFKLPDYHRTLL